MELGQFEGQRDPVASIPSKVCACRSFILIGGNLRLSKESCGLVLSPLNSRSIPGWDLSFCHFVVFLDKTLSY